MPKVYGRTGQREALPYNRRMSEPQTTDHVLLIEPGCFFANPQTMATNQYQHDDAIDHERIFHNALHEFRTFRDALVEAGVNVTTLKGSKDLPDHIFCNWVSMHPHRRMVLYPMLAANRQAERRPGMLAMLGRSYDLHLDLREAEKDGRFLEATGSLALDRANKIAYAGKSARTDEGLVKEWCEAMEYKPVYFQTRNHAGEPVYHTDLVMWIGTDTAACCFECIWEEDRARVRDQLAASGRFIVDLSMNELAGFCGNSLEIRGVEGQKYLAMSSRAFAALSEQNRKILVERYDDIIHTSLTTIERYGGGSARCMLTELF